MDYELRSEDEEQTVVSNAEMSQNYFRPRSSTVLSNFRCPCRLKSLGPFPSCFSLSAEED